MKNLTSQTISSFLGKNVTLVDGNLVKDENGREIYQILTKEEYEKTGFDDYNDIEYTTEDKTLVFVKQ